MAKFTNQDLRSRFQYEVDSIAAVELLIVSHDLLRQISETLMFNFFHFLSIPRSRMISWSHDVFATIKQSRSLNPDLSHVAVNLTRLSERTRTFFTCRYEWLVTRCHMCEKWPLCGCDGCQLFQMMIEWHESTLWKHEPLVSRRPLKQATVANLFVVQPPPLSLCTSVRSVCVCVCVLPGLFVCLCMSSHVHSTEARGLSCGAGFTS